MGFLFRWYVKTLLDGNPFVVGITVVVAAALAAGPFAQALTSGDPAAIGLAAFVGIAAVILLVLAVVDRKLNPPKKAGKPANKAATRR